jgi:hypothetical protein
MRCVECQMWGVKWRQGSGEQGGMCHGCGMDMGCSVADARSLATPPHPPPPSPSLYHPLTSPLSTRAAPAQSLPSPSCR